MYKEFMKISNLSPTEHPDFLRRSVAKLPLPHTQTLCHLIRHLHRVSMSHHLTGMTPRNLAIVWAPNLLRHRSQDCLKDCGIQAIVIESLIVHCQEIFGRNDQQSKPLFSKEVSIDQAVARAQTFKSKPNRQILRSSSFSKSAPKEGENAELFQRRGVTMRRERSLVEERMVNNTKASQVQSSEDKSDRDLVTREQLTFDKLCARHKAMVTGVKRSDTLLRSREQEAVDSTERSGRSRLRSQLDRLRAQSRSRLRSFVAGDLRNLVSGDLGTVRAGLRKSREKLSSHTTAAAQCLTKRRSGSYNLNIDVTEKKTAEKKNVERGGKKMQRSPKEEPLSTLANNSKMFEAPLARLEHRHMENKTEMKTVDTIVTEEEDRIRELREGKDV